MIVRHQFMDDLDFVSPDTNLWCFIENHMHENKIRFLHSKIEVEFISNIIFYVYIFNGNYFA